MYLANPADKGFFIFNQKGEVCQSIDGICSLLNPVPRSSSLGCTGQIYGMISYGTMGIPMARPVNLHFYSRSIADVFRIQVVSNNDVRSPIVTLGSTSFFHVRVNNVYVVAVTKCVQALSPCIFADILPYQMQCKCRPRF